MANNLFQKRLDKTRIKMANKKQMEEKEYVEKRLSDLMEFTMRMENEIYSLESQSEYSSD